MAQYLEFKSLVNYKNIIKVQTEEHGSINVIPVDAILDIELVDAPPLKHSKWVNEHYLIGCDEWSARCSQCHGLFESKYMPSGTYGWCPMCGARMDLKDGDTIV